MTELKSCLKKDMQYDPYVNKYGSNITRSQCKNMVNEMLNCGVWKSMRIQVLRSDPRGEAYGAYDVSMEFIYSEVSTLCDFVKELWLAGYEHNSTTGCNGWSPIIMGLNGVGYGRTTGPYRKIEAWYTDLKNEPTDTNMDYFHSW